jgi:hypothetical protein
MKKTDVVHFGALDHFLHELGFERSDIPHGYAYVHLRARAGFFLRARADHEPVSATEIAVVRRYLDECGLMEREDFENLIHSGALAG